MGELRLWFRRFVFHEIAARSRRDRRRLDAEYDSTLLELEIDVHDVLARHAAGGNPSFAGIDARSILGRLRPRPRKILELWSRGNSAAEIGASFDPPLAPDHVRQIKRRALLELRQRLDRSID